MEVADAAPCFLEGHGWGRGWKMEGCEGRTGWTGRWNGARGVDGRGRGCYYPGSTHFSCIVVAVLWVYIDPVLPGYSFKMAHSSLWVEMVAQGVPAGHVPTICSVPLKPSTNPGAEEPVNQ